MCYCINNKLDTFLNDIVFINVNEKKINLIREKNTNIIKNNVLKLKDKIGYLDYSYDDKNIFVNQNYIDETSEIDSDIFNWEKYCVFRHHNLLDNFEIEKFNKKIKRFNYIFENFCEKNCLIHVTKILNCNNEIDVKNQFINVKNKNNIHCFMAVIICSDNLEEKFFFENKILFLIKKCKPVKNNEEEELLNFEKELSIINNFFNFEPIEKNSIDELVSYS
jgi:hypothetical protein